jgi:hypothetical protein
VKFVVIDQAIGVLTCSPVLGLHDLALTRLHGEVEPGLLEPAAAAKVDLDPSFPLHVHLDLVEQEGSFPRIWLSCNADQESLQDMKSGIFIA